MGMVVRYCRQGLPKLLPAQQPPCGIDNLSHRQETIDQAGSLAQDRDAYPPVINTLFVPVCVCLCVCAHPCPIAPSPVWRNCRRTDS